MALAFEFADGAQDAKEQLRLLKEYSVRKSRDAAAEKVWHSARNAPYLRCTVSERLETAVARPELVPLFVGS